MKTLQKRVQILYRFRCGTCKSKFEMTGEEKIENDLKFDDRKYKGKRRDKACFQFITPDRFDCPICGFERNVLGGYMHRFAVMDDGTEIQEY